MSEKPFSTSQVPQKDTFFKYTILCLVIALLLYFGRNLFIPLSFAFLISCVLYPSCRWMEQRGIHRVVSIFISLTGLFIFFVSLLYLLILQFSKFSREWSALEVKINALIQSISIYISENLGISIAYQSEWIRDLLDSSSRQILPVLRGTAYSLSVSLVLLLLIPVLSGLILYYRRALIQALFLAFPDVEESKMNNIITETILSYTNFIKGMALVYLIVGILNSIGLAIIGVPHPVLFGFIASILTFIPYVGIMVASLLPVAVSWITFNSVWYPIAVLFVFGIVQILEAQIIFPFAVSNRLNINTLFTIIAILAGGIIWGTAGMILFVPFLGILKLIADKTDSMKMISILLSGNSKT
ncbi:MAG: AI-2E family transporter [Saprospiraceae bacterium]|nr:AI-2E family transporter [Saprospiraceae bacterium]